MVKEIVMPKLGTTMKEGILTDWHKELGDYVEAGELLMTVESNKAQVDIDSTASGYLVKILHEEGDEVGVTEPVGYLADSPGELPDSGTPVHSAAGTPEPGGAGHAAAEAQAPPPKTGPAKGGRVAASPKAKALAKEQGVDLSALTGTGVDGMVTAGDVEKAAAARGPANAPPPAQTGVAGVGIAAPLEGIRRTIADNMLKSVQTMAHAYHWLRVDMAAVVEAKNTLAKAGQKRSLNSFLLLAATRALCDHPALNSTLTEEGLTAHEGVNLGVAVALEEGLIVPNIKDAQCKNLRGLQAEAAALAQSAREGGLSPEQYRGGTFTVTNLGMHGLDGFFAIVNPPEVGILAAGRVADEAVAKDGEIVIRPMMTLGLTYDHRAVDGAVAARFLTAVREYLEAPCRML